MSRFWPIVEPLLTSLRPRSIVAVGEPDAAIDAALSSYAREHDTVVSVVGGAEGEAAVEAMPRVAGEAEVVLAPVESAESGIATVLALLDAFSPPVPGGFPVCVVYGEALPATRAEIENMTRITSRELAFGLAPDRDDVGVICERELLGALWRAASEPASGNTPDAPDELRGRLAERDGRVALLEAELLQREDYLATVEATMFEQAQALSATWSSSYWRLTEPLRRAVGACRAARDRLRAVGRRAPAVSIPLASLDWVELGPPGSGTRAARWGRAPQIGMRTRWRLEQRPPSRIAYRVAVAPGMTFGGQVAVRARAWATSQAGAQVRVRLLGADREPLATFAAELDHGGSAELSGTFVEGGDDCLLVIEADPLGPAAPHAAIVVWDGPELSVPAPRKRGRRPSRIPRGLLSAHGRRRLPRGSPPTISVLVPVHDPPPEFVKRAIESVVGQSYPRWQLCVVDDGSRDPAVRELLEAYAASDERIQLQRREQAGGISSATNAALGMATGEFVALLDHDDELAPTALAEVVAHLRAQPDTDVVYTDEDRLLADGSRFGGVLKPDWSPDLLRASMYTCHLGVYRRALVEEVGGFRGELDGSQDFDLMLRLAERTARIGHVPEVLYHWRASDASVAINPTAKPYAYEAGRRAVQEHLDRTGVAGVASPSELPGLYRIAHRVDPAVTVSIVVVANDAAESSLAELHRCAEGVAARTGHEAWELLCVAPPERFERCAQTLGAIGDHRVRTLLGPEGSPRSGLIEHGARAASGEHLILLDAPCVPLDEGWLSALLGFSTQTQVGAVGAKVLRRDGAIEHAGLVLAEGLPLPAYRGVRGDYVGYLGTLSVPCNYLAVAGALMTRREVFLRLGGLADQPSPLAAADYCLRAREEGLRIVFAPDARLELAGPAARDPVPLSALAAFKLAWGSRVPRDPYYHPDFWQQRAALPAPPPAMTAEDAPPVEVVAAPAPRR
jgi:GT2 family glycosyltransferase